MKTPPVIPEYLEEQLGRLIKENLVVSFTPQGIRYERVDWIYSLFMCVLKKHDYINPEILKQLDDPDEPI
jgi:hypothetical protein